ncbi:MAG: hypothetical protein ACI4VN_04315 [Clostridia bacterium]
MKNERGITLLTLIITIVIMIVLAVIVINVALGDNGIFKNTKTAKIMNKVQALDDSIKAYTLKNNDPYSSSKKTINDLISEGILKKITLTGENITSEEDDKSIYYVNFENAGLEVAQTLGLKSEDFENSEKLTSFTYTRLSDLQDKGIYVVDNDLNAAYLKDNRTYGTLTNFGEKENIDVASEYASQKLKLIVNPSGEVTYQEAILVIDRTVSMALADSAKDTEDITLIKNSDGTIDYVASYNTTRWACTVKALDTFVQRYFENCPNGKVSIYTFYGGKNDGGIELLGSCSSESEAKSKYANIFTEDQFRTAVSKLITEYDKYKYMGRSQAVRQVNNYYFGGTQYFNVDSSGNYQIDCRFANQQFSTLFNGDPARLGYSTCAPNALYKAYLQAQTNAKNSILTNVIIMTDGDSNTYWSPCSDKYSIGTVAKSIRELSVGEKNFGVYAIELGYDLQERIRINISWKYRWRL